MAVKKKKKASPTKGPSRVASKETLPKGSRPGDRVVLAEFMAGATQLDQFPPPTVSEIAFAGRSNVGKSSLMNCLTSRKNLVRTSGTPGCTRQVSWFRTVSDDKAIIDLIDLPGYGYAKRSKTERRHWGDLIEGYLMERATLKGVVLLLDIRRGAEEDDLELVQMLTDQARISRAPLELTVVATKMDKLPNAAHKPALLRLEQELKRPVLAFSSTSGLGRVALWRRLRRIAGVVAPEGATEVPKGPPAESRPAKAASEGTNA